MRADQGQPKNIDDYIAGFPPAVQRVLKTVRKTIRKTLPGAEESISYRIPTYKINGRYVIYFAGFKQHYSLYPVNDRLVAGIKEAAPYEVNTRGTIRFPLSEPVPVRLIARIARLRAKDVAAREKAKARVNPRESRRRAGRGARDRPAG